jgi:pterin-4a-carbinolamine dehydratase/ribosomal protein S27E
MTLRRKNGKYFWGSRDYPRYKETRPFQAEEFNAEGAPLSGQTTEAPYEIKVYVPSTTLDQPISASDFKSRIDETQEKLSELFGGFTTVDASGGYLSQQDGVISEPVIVVSSWATEEDYQSKLGDLERFLKQKKDDWGQEVIGFEFENDFFMYPAFEAEGGQFAAEEIRCCKECDKTTGLTTIQAGTYCYDCLPINLGAESSEENFACTDYIIDEIKRIWYSPAQKDIKHWAEHNMAGGGLGAYYDRFDLPDGSELGEDTTKDEYFQRMFDIWLEAFEEGTWMYSDDGHGIMMQAWRVLYVPVGTPVNVDSLGNWENRKQDQYGVYGDKITSWLWQSEFYAGALFGHEGIDHMEGEEGKDFDRIVLTAWIPWEAVDWASTIAYNISFFWQENELCVKDKETVYELNYSRNWLDEENHDGEASLDKAMNAEDDYDSTYGVEQAKIRRRLKNKIKKQAIMGTKAGQWSARKSQELKRQYEAACDKKGLNSYKGKKTKSQDNLSKWSKQKWGTASGKKSSTTGEPYFPAKAVAALKDKGLYSKAKQQKKAATKAGKQNARYSDDIRAVVKNYRSETYEEATGVEFSEQNPEKIEADAPPDWRESIITIPQSDSFGYALYRKMSDLTYNQVWRVLELIDDLNRMSHHHALTRFSSNYVEIWIYSHDSGLVMPKDYHWAEDFNDMIATVDWQMWESETEWEEVDWEKEKPAKDQNDWGDDVEWEAEDDWGSLRPETRPEFPTVDAKIASMLRNHSKVNVNGEQGCPRCGQEDLFYRESTGTGTKWYCYGCFYTEKTESQKSQKIITLEKYGLKVRCPDCDEMIVAYNQASLNSHRKKCGVTK